MTAKTKVAKRIQDLQAQADAICRACSLAGSSDCAGPNCNEIVRIVNEIDPLVTEYFRIELLEQRRAVQMAEREPVWQCLLPLEVTTGSGVGSPTPLLEEQLLPRSVAAEAGPPLEQVSLASMTFRPLELRLFAEEVIEAARPTTEPAGARPAELAALQRGTPLPPGDWVPEQGASLARSRARRLRRRSSKRQLARHPVIRLRVAGR